MFGLMLRTFQRALRNWKVDLKNLNPSNLESRVPTVENWDQNCCWFEVFSYIIYIHIHCILHHKHSRSNVLYNAISKIHSCETIGTKKRHFPDRLRIHHWVHSSPGWTGARHWGHEKEQFRSFENLTLKFPAFSICSAICLFFPFLSCSVWNMRPSPRRSSRSSGTSARSNGSVKTRCRVQIKDEKGKQKLRIWRDVFAASQND